MTYAGLKSMIYAGLGKDDLRVKAALAYVKAHYTLDENPGLGQQGLYYYYHTFAKTMSVLGEPTLIDALGEPDWRARARSGPGETATTRRWLGQPCRPFHGGRSEPGDGLRSLVARVYACKGRSDKQRAVARGTWRTARTGTALSRCESSSGQVRRRRIRYAARANSRVVVEARNEVPVTVIDRLSGRATMFTITLRPSAPVAAMIARASLGRNEHAAAAIASGSSATQE